MRKQKVKVIVDHTTLDLKVTLEILLSVRNRPPAAGMMAEQATAGFLPATRVLRQDDSRAQVSDSVISSSSSH